MKGKQSSGTDCVLITNRNVSGRHYRLIYWLSLPLLAKLTPYGQELSQTFARTIPGRSPVPKILEYPIAVAAFQASAARGLCQCG